MVKKFLLAISLVFIVGAVAFFILTQKEDPLVLQAKAEIRRTNEEYLAFQNRVNAIPVLEVSKDVENDFLMVSSLFGTFGYLVPDVGG